MERADAWPPGSHFYERRPYALVCGVASLKIIKKSISKFIKTIMAKPRYTLHYTHKVRIKAGMWDEDWVPRRESMDFKTIGEAKDYLSIAGDNAYIIDNVTGKRI